MRKERRPDILPFRADDHILVVGLGRSGVAAARFLLGLGLKISVSEGGRAVAPASAAVAWLQERGVYCELGGHSPELFSSVDAIVVSPGVPLDIPALRTARRAGVPIIGELALAPAYLKTPVIAITGTNGKSTVTTLVGDLLRAAGLMAFVGGNLGVPLCEYLAGPQDDDWVVLELSSFQLDSAGDFRPRIGLLLNISPDHLDRYPDLAAYGAAKWRIFAHQEAEDYAIINLADPEIGRLAQLLPPRSACCAFSPAAGGSGAEHSGGKNLGENWCLTPISPPISPTPISPISQHPCDLPLVALARDEQGAGGQLSLELPGGGEEGERYELSGGSLAVEPNRQNAMAAILAARLAGCPPEAIRQGLAAFRPLPHRLALVATIAGVDFYDDSKATNIGAVISALQGMGQKVVLIAGGLDKGGDYALLLPVVREKVKALILIGSAREKMAAALGHAVPLSSATDLPTAVAAAFAMARPGEAVLLSPACASFDMFSGYVQRGEVFRKAVAELQESGGGTGGGRIAGCPTMEAMVV